MKIDIVGAGPAGLYFAILMKKRDRAHAITVSERDGPNDTFGWGIVFSQRTMDLLHDNDGETYAQILGASEQWEHTIAIHQGETIRVRGNRFYGIRRLTLLNLLHQRARDLGVELR